MKAGEDVANQIVAIEKDKRTWANTMLPMASFESSFSTTESNLTFYRYASMDKDLRDKSLAVEEQFDAWTIK